MKVETNKTMKATHSLRQTKPHQVDEFGRYLRVNFCVWVWKWVWMEKEKIFGVSVPTREKVFNFKSGRRENVCVVVTSVRCEGEKKKKRKIKN